jgi:hypothetical protein
MVVLAEKKAWSPAKKFPHRLVENGFCICTRVLISHRSVSNCISPQSAAPSPNQPKALAHCGQQHSRQSPFHGANAPCILGLLVPTYCLADPPLRKANSTMAHPRCHQAGRPGGQRANAAGTTDERISPTNPSLSIPSYPTHSPNHPSTIHHTCP